jgi:hypothetical protein
MSSIRKSAEFLMLFLVPILMVQGAGADSGSSTQGTVIVPLSQMKAGDRVQVSFSDGSSESCQFSHQEQVGQAVQSGQSEMASYFSCQGSDGQSLLSSLNPDQWVALKRSSDGKVSVPQVTSVSQGSTVYYQQAVNADPTVGHVPDLNSEGYKLSDVNSYFFAHDPKSEQSPEFKQAFNSLKAASFAREDEIETSLSKTPEVNVKFTNGSTAHCERLKESADPGIGCGFFKCDPIDVDGKKYSMLFAESPDFKYNSSPPSAVIMSNEGPSPILTAESVTSASSGELLYQNWFEQNGMGQLDPAARLDQKFSADPLFRVSSGNSDFLNYRRNVGHGCKSSEVSDEISAENSWVSAQRADLQKRDLALLVEDINHTLATFATEKSLLPPDACHLTGDTYVSREAAAQYKDWKAPDPTAQKEVTPDQADEIFQEVAAMKDIPYRYVADGCYARAEIIAERLAKEGIIVDKVWAEDGILKPNSDLEWNYHVAPVIWVHEKNGTYDRKVLDPSLEDHPVAVNEWLGKFWNSSSQGKYINQAWPVPPAQSTFDRTVVYFTPSSVYAPDQMSVPDAQTHARDLEDARTTLAKYSQLLGEGDADDGGDQQ